MTVSRGALVPVSEVRRGRIVWLRAPWIPCGGISLLAGDPGVGKTLFSLRTVAQLSRGELTGEPERSLILTAEDPIAGIVKPRLQEAGADMSLVLVPSEQEQTLWLPKAVAQIETWVAQHELKLVVIDPLTAFLPDNSVDTHRDSSVRTALAPLHRLADRYAIAVLGVLHLNKASGSDPIRRLGGSIGLPAAARSVLLLARDPDQPNATRRVLAHVKNNFAPLAPSLSLEIQQRPGADQPHLVEVGASRYRARDLLDEPESPLKLDEAVDFLTDELANGPLPATRVYTDATAAGISQATLRRAKDQLDIHPTKIAFDHWQWALPNTVQDNSDEPAA